MRVLFAAIALAAAVAANAQYQIVIAGATFGNNTTPYNNGVLRYKIGAGGVATAATGIAPTAVVDPAGVGVSASGEIFIGNRNGNTNNANGGSVSRFLLNAATDAFVANGSFATGATGTHGVSFSPTTGELFASNVQGGVTRFNLSGSAATPNGTLGSGTTRDTFVSPNGLYAYVTEGASGNLLQYSVATGALLNTYGVSGASGLHFGNWRGSDLYVADFGSGNVYDLTFGASGTLATSTLAAYSNASIGVAFSPDGNEMFVPGHTTGLVSRFAYAGGAWVADGAINTGVQMGDIAVIAPVPEPASFAALGIGLVALAKRRKR